MGSFLFLGPSGVGKTLLSKALAEFMFGDEDALVQIDMSEYMEKHNVSRLIGAPPGYVGYEEGGQLTERIRRRPYSVVLLDEVEKAHPDVFNMLLQIMEEGRLTDSFGRHVDFRNVVMIMTSNIGSDLIKGGGPSFGLRPMAKGQQEERNYQQIKDTVMKELERYFRPEFIGRLDDVIVFRPLGRPQLEQIVEFELKKVTKRLVDHGLRIEITNEAKEFLIDKGTNADFGARPLRRAIEQHVEDPLSEDILRGSFKGKDMIKITVKGETAETKHLFFEAVTTTSGEEQKQLAQAGSDAT
jgi:ATP-dependent Clp protease ATP-binding subunit ClpC